MLLTGCLITFRVMNSPLNIYVILFYVFSSVIIKILLHGQQLEFQFLCLALCLERLTPALHVFRKNTTRNTTFTDDKSNTV